MRLWELIDIMYDMKVSKRVYSRVFCVVVVLLMTVTCSSCGESVSSDSSMTQSLIDSYMNSFCDYNISGMNKCCMANRDPYGDSEAAVKACRSLAQRIKWEKLNISIDGNSAIAQIRILFPEDMEEICRLALNDTIKALDSGSDDNCSELLVSMIKKRAVKAKKQELSVEIHMTKVDNKWYIVKSLGVNRILSEIRTSVAAVYSMIEE